MVDDGMKALRDRGYESFIRLDSGGQANVYKSVKNGNAYAIKVVRVENPEKDIQLTDDLARELTIISKLRHPNCIRLEEMFRTRHKFFIIMDFLPNGTIGTLVRKNGPLCEWNTKLWFCPIACAVKYLHENKVAHRDLKLDNVLLDGYLNPVVTDFGFSRFVSFDKFGHPQKSNTYCGTTSYNPPEVLKQIPYDPFKGDAWCLGICLFIMINQVYPFDRRDKAKMYENQMKRNYKLQEEVEGRVSNEVKHLIHVLLEPHPEKRPSVKTVCSHVWFPLIMQDNEPEA